jgi:O-antigen/teichoic acid export membrane protein
MTAKLQLEERFSLLGVWQFIQNTLSFISVIILMFVFNNIEIKTVTLSFVISSLICIGFAFRPLLNLFNGHLALPQHEPPLSTPNPIISAKLQNVFCQSYPFALSGLMYIIYFQSDIILLNYLDSSSAAGIYNIAFTVMAAVYLFPNIFYQKFLLPKLHRWKAHDQEKLNST